MSTSGPAHLLHPFTDPHHVHADGPHVFVRGEGIHVWDADGNQFIDGLAGLWCAALGYGRPELAEAAARQMRTLSYAKSFFGQATPPLIELSNSRTRSPIWRLRASALRSSPAPAPRPTTRSCAWCATSGGSRGDRKSRCC